MMTSFGRFVLVGAAATALHSAVLLTLVTFTSAGPGFAAAAGAVCGAALAYAGARVLVFRGTRASHRDAAPRFVMVASSSALVSGGVVSAGTTVSGGSLWLWQLLATGVMLVFGFVANKRWTFA